MKRFIGIFLLCFCSVIGAFSQSAEESVLFGKINHYRDSLGLNRLVWDTTVYKMASHHAKYITIINSAPYNKGILTHREDSDVIGFQELNTLEERSKKIINRPNVYFAENCAITDATKKTKIPQLAFMAWFKSTEGHREIMELKNATIASCSIQTYDMEIITKTGKKLKKPLAVIVLNIH